MSKISDTSPPETSREWLSNSYSPYFLSILKLAYDSNIISQGGIHSIDVMFSHIDLNNLKILDVGSGFGGVDIYLAQKYKVQIVGVDRESYMLSRADKVLSENKNLKGEITYHLLDDPFALTEFSDCSFDLVFSKEMLYHIPTDKKEKYVQEMSRVLKPQGKLIIADWITRDLVQSDQMKKAYTKGFAYFITREEYQQILQNLLIDISFSDLSSDHIQYTKNELSRLNNSKNIFCQKFGLNSFLTTLENWNLWLQAIESGELKAALFVGRKP